MKKLLVIAFLGLFSLSGMAQKHLKIAIVISTNDPETAWNALRVANYAAGEKDSVSVFLLGKGVEIQKTEDKDFDVRGMMKTYIDNGGKVLACGTCLRMREMEGTKECPVSSLSELYGLIKSSDKILTF